MAVGSHRKTTSATSAVEIDSSPGAPWNGYYKSGVSEAAIVNVSSYSSGGGNVSYGLAKIDTAVTPRQKSIG